MARIIVNIKPNIDPRQPDQITVDVEGINDILAAAGILHDAEGVFLRQMFQVRQAAVAQQMIDQSSPQIGQA